MQAEIDNGSRRLYIVTFILLCGMDIRDYPTDWVGLVEAMFHQNSDRITKAIANLSSRQR